MQARPLPAPVVPWTALPEEELKNAVIAERFVLLRRVHSKEGREIWLGGSRDGAVSLCGLVVLRSELELHQKALDLPAGVGTSAVWEEIGRFEDQAVSVLWIAGPLVPGIPFVDLSVMSIPPAVSLELGAQIAERFTAALERGARPSVWSLWLDFDGRLTHVPSQELPPKLADEVLAFEPPNAPFPHRTSAVCQLTELMMRGTSVESPELIRAKAALVDAPATHAASRFVFSRLAPAWGLAEALLASAGAPEGELELVRPFLGHLRAGLGVATAVTDGRGWAEALRKLAAASGFAADAELVARWARSARQIFESGPTTRALGLSWLSGQHSDRFGGYGREAQLSRADLSSIDLCGADLRGADFSEANLTSARLIACELSGADFRGSLLTGATLSGSNIEGTRFTKSELVELGREAFRDLLFACRGEPELG